MPNDELKPLPITALAHALMERELAKHPEQFAAPRALDLGLGRGNEMRSLAPETAALFGGLADAASTYTFLKRGTGREGNALYKSLGNHPEGTALAVAGAALAGKAARGRLRKWGLHGLADALAGTLGATQAGVAAYNWRLAPRRRGSQAAIDDHLRRAVTGISK